MFNFFKKRQKSYQPISEYPDTWSILLEKNHGTLIRVNTGLKDAIGHPEYPIRIGVAVPIKTAHNEGVASLKDSIEEAIHNFFQKDKGILAVVITKLDEEKFIEFVLYTREHLDFASIHQILKNKFPGEDIQMYAEKDPDWTVYLSFLK